MDIIKHYSAKVPCIAPGMDQSAAREIQYKSGDAYRKMIEELEAQNSGKAPDPSAKLYNGSTARAKLSDTEIAVLANRYDVRDMSDEEYEDFLDDLESMGAISKDEKQRLGCKGIGILDIGGEKDSAELHSVLAGIVGRMAVRRTDDEEAQRKAGLVRQLADGNSDFYANMISRLKAQVEKTQEDDEEQAIIDALGAVLDAMSGKKDVTGKKASLNQSTAELTRKISERISKLDPNDPEDKKEIDRLEQMLKRLQQMGLYFDLGSMDRWWEDEEETFETLTQLLTRRQAEELRAAYPNEKEVSQAE